MEQHIEKSGQVTSKGGSRRGVTINNNFLDVTYRNVPYSDYPGLLTKYLFNRYSINSGARLLDLGCGRGEFLQGFIDQGVEGYGFDQSDKAKDICSTAKLFVGNLNDPLPFEDNYFDVVYSKSVIEHFYFPETIIQEIYRVLAPGGLVITMTPDWSYNFKWIYEDYTHRTLFTLRSLSDIHEIHHFKSVSSERFIQLPFVWNNPSLRFIPFLCRNLLPDSMKNSRKLVRFSKEIMLLATAVK